MRRRDFTVVERLGAGVLVSVVLVTALAAASLVWGRRVIAQQAYQAEVLEPRARAAGELETAVLYEGLALRTYGLTRAAGDFPTLVARRADVARALDQLARLPGTADGARIFDVLVGRNAQYQAAVDRLAALVTARAGDPSLALGEKVADAQRERLLDSVRSFERLQSARVSVSRAEVRAATHRLVQSLAGLALMVVATSILSAYLVVRWVRKPARALVAAAHAVAGGDYGLALALDETGGTRGRIGDAPQFRDELREVANVFGRMAGAVRQREGRLSALARLSAQLARALDAVQLADGSLREIGNHLGAWGGAVFVRGAGEELTRLATLEVDPRAPQACHDESLAAKAIAERGPVVRRLESAPRGEKGREGAGAQGVSLIATPLEAGGRVVGAMTVAVAAEAGDHVLAFLQQVAPELGVSLDNALAHSKVAALAEELQTKNELLQVQNEELQAQGEELQRQNEELQVQGEELQAQGEELQAQADQLQRTSEEIQMQRDELQSRHDELAHEGRRKNEFLAMLSHELRNPLGVINTALAVLERLTCPDDSTAEVREVIKRQARHLARMVDDLLDVGRVISGKVLLTRRPLDFGEAVARSVGTLNATGRLATRETSVKVEPVWVLADETRIEQIVANLVGNAVKYTPTGGRISVSVAREGGTAVLRVQDSGNGIRPDLLPRIFELFVQDHLGPDRSQGGLGVGLTLVKHLVELHGGTVAAASPGPGLGSLFTVELPAFADVPSFPEVRTTPREAGRRSIVIVEDNSDARLMLRSLLELAGHEVHEAGDGPTGVDLVRTRRPHVALVDVGLPGFDGYEVARRVRRDPGAAAVRLVAITGYGQPEDVERARSAGFDDHLVKPVDPEHLSAAIGDDGSGG